MDMHMAMLHENTNVQLMDMGMYRLTLPICLLQGKHSHVGKKLRSRREHDLEHSPVLDHV